MVTFQQATNEALWRPTVPLIVLDRVPEPVLRSVWLSLRWLTALVPHHTDGFKPRDLVELAGVSDSHIHRYLATLVERGVVWKFTETDSAFPHRIHGGTVKAVRYGIKLDELERLSIELYPQYVERYSQRFPRPKTPRVQPLVARGSGTTHVPVSDMVEAQIEPFASNYVPDRDMQPPPNAAGRHALNPKRDMDAPTGDMHARQPAMNTPNRGMDVTYSAEHVPHGDESMSPDRTSAALFISVEEERQKEREKNAPARTLVANHTNTHAHQGNYAPPPEALFAAHPLWIRSGPLLSHPIAIWQQVAGERLRATDAMVLTDLAGQLDGGTGGHGWYWLGRAILAASLLDAADLPYIRKMITRWREEDAYGSDSPKRAYTRRDPDGRPASRHERGRPAHDVSNLRAGGRSGPPGTPFDGWQRD